jgi:tetratricopeptide (TPR) repeat protein
MIGPASLSLLRRTMPLLFFSLLLAGCSKEPRFTTSSPEALRLYQDGVTQWERFYYREAKESLEKALGYDSTFALAWARLAAVNLANQDEPQALNQIARAMRLMGRTTRREQLFIRMLDRQIHYDNEAAGEIADSLTKLFPDEKDAYVVRGTIYQLNNNFEAAIRSYEKAVTVDTAYALAYMYIGYAYSNLGDQEKALSNMEHYIALAPDGADPRASYADLLMRVGRYDDALGQYQKALSLKPDYWYCFNQIGNIEALEGMLKAAEADFQKSLKMRPSTRGLEAAHLAVAGALNLYRAKYREAIELYQTALSIDSTNGTAAYGMVYALARLKEFSQAWYVVGRIRQENARRNLLNATPMLGFYLTQADLFMEEGRLDEAIAVCDSAREFSDPLTRGEVYAELAEIYFRQKAYDDALDASEEALRLNPNAPRALLTLVKIYHATGDKDMTREIGGRLLDFWKNADPDFQRLIELKHLLRSSSTQNPART